MSSPSIKGNLELGGRYVSLPQGLLTVSGPRELIVVPSRIAAYEPDGHLAGDTVRVLGREMLELGSVPKELGDERVAHVYDGEVVWAGDAAAPLGRFLREGVSRLWPLLPGGKLEGHPVVWTKLREQPFVEEWLRAFGVRAVDLPQDGAVRFTKMFVPEPAWRLNTWIAPEIRDIHLHARHNLDLHPSPRHDLLWISRSGLGRRRVAYDECLLEWLLGEHVTTIRLDTMTLAEQVAAFESSRAVAGVVGSAFHTLLMTIDTPECLYLCPPWDKGDLPAQHRLLKGTATFVRTLSVAAWTRRVSEEGIFFPDGYRISIPETLLALSETVHPTLLEDPRLAAFSQSERRRAAGGKPFASDLDKAVADVLLDPLSLEARMRLGATFQAEGLDRCALEQFAMVADLTDERDSV